MASILNYKITQPPVSAGRAFTSQRQVFLLLLPEYYINKTSFVATASASYNSSFMPEMTINGNTDSAFGYWKPPPPSNSTTGHHDWLQVHTYLLTHNSFSEPKNLSFPPTDWLWHCWDSHRGPRHNKVSSRKKSWCSPQGLEGLGTG